VVAAMSMVQLTADVDSVPAPAAAPDVNAVVFAVAVSDGAVGVDMPQALTSAATVARTKV
jgi:hypothetical protein